MKLLRTTRLNKAQRVYEVDLCDLGDDRGVVNFRHGQAGRLLKDGTHTVHPLPLDKASALFDTMVQRKRADGYVSAEDAVGTPGSAVTEGAPVTVDQRAQHIVRHLQNGGSSHWNLDRIVWRAGELRIYSAAPALLPHTAHPDQLRVYSAVWSLARCGNPVAVPVLTELQKTGPTDAVRRMAVEGLRALLPDAGRAALIEGVAASLPVSIASARAEGSAELVQAVRVAAEGSRSAWSVLHALYLLDDDISRQALCVLLRDLPLVPGTMRPFRHIYKAAEVRGDGLIFGLCARLAAIRPAFAGRPRWGASAVVKGHGYVNLDKELPRDESRVAWLQVTRRWFRRRVWRHLRRLGEAGSDEYVVMAAGLVSAFTEKDARSPYVRRDYDWRTRSFTDEKTRGPWHGFFGFSHVLWHHDDRLEFATYMLGFYQVSDVARDRRLEAFPSLWDARPDVLVHLLSSARNAPAHDVFARALRSNLPAWSVPAVADLVMWLDGDYAATQSLASDIALGRYDRANPDDELVLAMACTSYGPARAIAHGWLSADLDLFLDMPELLAKLALVAHRDTRQALHRLVSSRPVSAARRAALFESLLQAVVDTLGFADDIAQDVFSLLSTALPNQARTVPIQRIVQLLDHAQASVQGLGARLLLGHEIRPVDLPDGLLQRVMDSEHASVRGTGLRLFGDLPDELLLARREQLVHLAASPHADVRKAMRPLLARLSAHNSTYASHLLVNVLVRLCSPGDEAVLIDLFVLARDHLPAYAIPSSSVYDLLCSRNEPAWRLALVRLPQLQPTDLTVQQLAEHADHDWAAIREGCRAHLEARRDALPDALPDVVHTLVDASWPDSRDWAFQFLGSFDGSIWTPDLLVEVCDSVQPDVQAFGRQLITRFFEEKHGQRYLLRLAQHPSSEMQLYATSYLDRFAAGDLRRMQGLRSFFVTVLTGVNKGRVAKARVFALLAAQAKRDAKSAALVAEILDTVSATISVRDRARAIEILLDVAMSWPDIPVPIKLRPAAVRGDRAV